MGEDNIGDIEVEEEENNATEQPQAVSTFLVENIWFKPVLGGVALIILCCICCVFIWYFKKRKVKQRNVENIELFHIENDLGQSPKSTTITNGEAFNTFNTKNVTTNKKGENTNITMLSKITTDTAKGTDSAFIQQHLEKNDDSENEDMYIHHDQNKQTADGGTKRGVIGESIDGHGHKRDNSENEDMYIHHDANKQTADGGTAGNDMATKGQISECGQCNLVKEGKIDSADGIFYCHSCWNEFYG